MTDSANDSAEKAVEEFINGGGPGAIAAETNVEKEELEKLEEVLDSVDDITPAVENPVEDSAISDAIESESKQLDSVPHNNGFSAFMENASDFAGKLDEVSESAGPDESLGTSELEVKEKEVESLVNLDENKDFSAVAHDLVSNGIEKTGETSTATVEDRSINASAGGEYEEVGIPERTDNQPPPAETPLVLRKSSWMNCCGLLGFKEFKLFFHWLKGFSGSPKSIRRASFISSFGGRPEDHQQASFIGKKAKGNEDHHDELHTLGAPASRTYPAIVQEDESLMGLLSLYPVRRYTDNEMNMGRCAKCKLKDETCRSLEFSSMSSQKHAMIKAIDSNKKKKKKKKKNSAIGCFKADIHEKKVAISFRKKNNQKKGTTSTNWNGPYNRLDL
ncbi:hypothetical protein RJ641_016381 [Dillenia turbinata]|uniref:Uncharacterized protein n=1 Tax=Dillenia turbinata TaxID=194707 RepID=A0AAN8URR8_9MAGN